MEETNPIKEYLFEYINSSQTIPKLVSEKKFDRIIEEVTCVCYDKVVSMGGRAESIGIMITVLLHHLLTCALIPSQRKTEFGGTKLDIVIPDVRTLKVEPERALIIGIPCSEDLEVVGQKVAELEKIQPEAENIWLVLSEDIAIGKKSFVLSREHNTFSGIITEIARFGNVGNSKLKILRG